MPAAKPPEFRRRAVELARRREQSIAKIAADRQVATSPLPAARSLSAHSDALTLRREEPVYS